MCSGVTKFRSWPMVEIGLTILFNSGSGRGRRTHPSQHLAGARELSGDVAKTFSTTKLIDKIADRLGARSEGERAAALELALEALYLAKKIDKNIEDGETVYG